MPSARANRARYTRLPLANQVLRIPIAIYLFELFLVRCFVISFFIWIIWARLFGLGICL